MLALISNPINAIQSLSLANNTLTLKIVITPNIINEKLTKTLVFIRIAFRSFLKAFSDVISEYSIPERIYLAVTYKRKITHEICKITHEICKIVSALKKSRKTVKVSINIIENIWSIAASVIKT